VKNTILKSLIFPFPPLERFGKPLLISVLVSPGNLLVGSPNELPPENATLGKEAP